MENGTGLKVAQRTNYPWDGNVEITITPERPSDFVFHLRIPGWADRAAVAVNGKSVTGVNPGEYLPLERRWSRGDVVRLQMDMPVQVVEANYHVIEDNGRVAIERGPLLYCLEEVDQPSVQLSEVAVDLGKNPPVQFQPERKPDLLGGVVVLRHDGVALDRLSGAPLYSRYAGSHAKKRQVPLTFIPYYAWANRNATTMQVWTPVAQG